MVVASGPALDSGAAVTKLPQWILLVEDDENDVVLMQRAFRVAEVPNPLMIASNGEVAIKLLEGEDVDPPSLLITDIKMPRVDGFELLLWLQTQAHLRGVPRLVISSSVLEEDLAKSLLLGATAYFTKPNSLRALVEMVRRWKDTYLKKESAPVPVLLGRTGTD